MPSEFEVIGNVGVTKTWFRASFASICPVPDPPEPFVGWTEVEYKPDEWVVEYVTFQEWVRRIGLDEGLSLEQVAVRVFEAIWEAVSPHWLRVRCSATSTAHPEAWAEVERSRPWSDREDSLLLHRTGDDDESHSGHVG